MAKREVRMGCNIGFDDTREKDILNLVDDLTSQRSLGRFVENLIRVYCEAVTEKQVQRVESQIGLSGLTKHREEFYKEVVQEVAAMRKASDEVHRMCLDMYTAMKFGQLIFPERQIQIVDNGNAVLKHKINSMCKSLGLSVGSVLFESGKPLICEEHSDRILSYIMDVNAELFKEINEYALNGLVAKQAIVASPTETEHDAEENGNDFSEIAKSLKEIAESLSKITSAGVINVNTSATQAQNLPKTTGLIQSEDSTNKIVVTANEPREDLLEADLDNPDYEDEVDFGQDFGKDAEGMDALMDFMGQR